MKMDKKTVHKLHITALIIVILLTIGTGLVIDFTNDIEEHFQKLTRERLAEYTETNAYAAEQELSNALNLVNNATVYFEALDPEDDHTLEMLRVLSADMPFAMLRFSNLEGKSYDGAGNEVDLSGTDYFKRAVLGESSIMTEDPTQTVDDNMLVISAPVIREGKVVGTLQDRKSVV